MGANLSLKVTAPLVLLGKTALNTAAQFEQSMANAASVSGASSEEFERMTDLARQMGKTTVFSASQAADAMYFMASAGYKVDQMANSIEPTLNLAAATQSELAYATETVIASLNQFQLDSSEAERVTNVFAAAIGNSQATMDKLKTSMSYIGPVANSLGWNIEEAAGALSVLYNAGYDGSTAGTSLRQSLVAIMNPSAKAKKIFEGLGIELEKLDPTTNKFSDIVDTLAKSGMTTAQAMEVFGARAGPGMMALLAQGGDAIADMTKSITGTTSASDMAEKQLNTFQGTSKLLKSQMEELAISIGNILIPILRELTSKNIMPSVDAFNSLSDSVKEMIVKIGMIAAAIGPFLLVLSKVVKAVSFLIKGLSLLASPIGLIIAAIVAAIAVLIHLFKTNEEFRAKVLKIWESIKNGIANAITAIKQWWKINGEKILQSVKNVFLTVVDIIKGAVVAVKSVIQKIVSSFKYLWDNNEELRQAIANIWKGIKREILSASKAIITWWKANGERIIKAVTSAFNKVWDIIISITDGILKSVTVFLNYLSPIWEQLKALFASLWNVILKLWELLKPVFIAIGAIVVTVYGIIIGIINGIIQALGPFIQAVISSIQFIIDIIGALISVLTGDFDGAWEHLKSAGQSFVDFFVHLWEGLLNFFKGFGEGITGFFLQLGVDLEAIVVSIGKSIADFFKGIWEGITGFCSNIWKSVTSVFNDIKDFISNVIADAFNWGKNLITSLGDGIKSAAKAVIDGVKDIGKSIAEFLGFSSPTKKGEGRYADQWMPNLMDMLKSGIDKGLPDIEGKVNMAAYNLKGISAPDVNYRKESGLVNSVLSALNVNENMNKASNQPIELSIDGQVFARLILPDISREFKRQGIRLKGVSV
ncbi:MAG: phage tail tape measure protein [Clostridia bacterium]|nr:phage tail tape measure protein [Clostridia bacterium]